MRVFHRLPRRLLRPALLLLCILLTACSAPSDSQIPADTTAPADTAAPALRHAIVRDGQSDYSVIRAELADPAVVQAASAVWYALKDNCGAAAALSDDWMPGIIGDAEVTSDGTVKEIVIGDTNRAESRRAAETYAGIYGYVIQETNGKIVIWGSSPEQTAYGADAFIAGFLTDSTAAIDAGYLQVSDLSLPDALCAELSDEFTVIFPYDLRAQLALPATDLSNLIGDIAGNSPDVLSDRTAPGKREILIGATNRPESAQAAADLQYTDYRIKVTPDRIIITGGSAPATVTAVEHFTELLLNRTITSCTADYEYRLDADGN